MKTQQLSNLLHGDMYKNLITKATNIIHTEQEHLRIGISSFYSSHFLHRIIPFFLQKYPRVTLDIIEKESHLLEEDTINSNLDLCMTPSPILHKELEYQTIYQEQILFALPKNHMLNEQI